MNCLRSWPEPVVRVQSLSESGLQTIPERYVKPLSDRPLMINTSPLTIIEENIPIIDLQHLFSNDWAIRAKTLSSISRACQEWGFFQVVNHGVNPELMRRIRELWREFFNQPLEVKQEYANDPSTYEGYGSRLGVLSNAIYKSVEHRVIVNSAKDRVSLAFFYNPKSDLLIEPAKQLVTEERPALYMPMTFDEYRLYIRTKGLKGKEQVESLKSPTSVLMGNACI
ncbi:hypothetical protein SLEP1_g31902 [Rubroshorea leprosula]|uniref:Non-haem dioxygenase N-terminal domain-containing protein n=1 Tax=Rubroshorea leprosula TaxID=152421 RepID=A0AAV5KBM9_9ROSI|nr:hypothetical protein SLEP1_g31902 [Rubroshorea leprosula]